MNLNHQEHNKRCASMGASVARIRRSGFVLGILAMVWCLSAPVDAKVVAGMSGIVTDPSGAIVAGATIQATATDTGIVATRQTNSEGFYAFVDLAPGHYDIEVRQTGFNTFHQKDILLDVDSAKVINIKLTVGQVSEKVEVTTDAVQLDTASTQNGEVISAQTITAVPLVTRSYTDLLALQPGVAASSSGLAGGQGGQFSATGFTFTPISGDLNAGNLSVNGQRESSNGFLLNGTTVQEFAFSGAGIIPNLDSISEFRIVTNNFDAEYGNYAGGQINVITKSGTNKFHGSAFEFLRNRSLDARNFFSQTKDDHKQNEFGGTIGGPIVRDKVFFFADYQGNRVIQGQSAGNGTIAVPTAAERRGDFTALASSFASGVAFVAGDANPHPVAATLKGNQWATDLGTSLGYTVNAGQPYYFTATTIDPTTVNPATGIGTFYGVDCTTTSLTTGCVFPNAQIPTTAFTTPSKNLLQFVPPGNAGDGLFSPVAAPIRLRDDKTSGRVDYNSHLGSISGYYFFDQYRESVPNLFLPGFGSDFTGRSQVVNVGDSKTLGPWSVNELRFGLTRLRFLIHKPTGGTDVTPASLGFEEGADTLGISPSLPQYAHVPNIHLNAFSFGASGGPLGVTETTFQVMDNFSRVIGTHTLTLGGQFRYNQLTEYNGGSNGDFTFNGAETGVDFADFLIGAPVNYSQGQGFPSYGRSRYIGLFGQDSWRVRPNLTLNYGLRWDVSRPWSEKNGQLETLVPGLDSTRFPGSPTGWVFPGDPGVPSTLAPTRYDNFAPRIGLAYSPSAEHGLLAKLTGGPGRTSIRAGWGKFYSTFEGATNFNEIGDAPFGIFYGSPVPPQFVTPFVDRGTGNIEGQRFPVALPTTDTPINWANFLPIGTSPAFWYKNRLPYTEEYQLSIQRQIGAATLLTASYVGTQGHHLMSSVEANPGNPALCLSVSDPTQVTDGITCGPNGENGVYHPVTGGTINSTRGPFGPSFSSDGYFVSTGKSGYNSLQLSLRQRISRLSFLAGYTYSKSLDNGSGYGEQINFLNPGLRALSAFDVRHNFVISYDYELPFDRLGGPSMLVKGWRVSGITRFSTGLPVTLVETDDHALLGTNSAGAISLPIDTPNFTPGSLKISDVRSGTKPYFNTALFSPEAIGTLGNSSRRFFSGPGLNNWDIAFLKDTRIKEGMNLEFRAELFNAFNHTQFGQPDGNVNDLQQVNPDTGRLTGFGTIQSANPARIMQLSLKLLF